MTEDLDKLIALLERGDRVCQIDLMGTQSPHHLEELLVAMQKPFPQLTYLRLWSLYMAPVVPDSFMGGSAVSLRELWLDRVEFLGLPKLLLSATNPVFFNWLEFPIPGTFHPRKWSLPSPR